MVVGQSKIFRPPQKTSYALQRSHWTVAGAREIPYEQTWTTQTSRDFIPPPPVDVDEFVTTRQKGAQRLMELRKHQFVVGSYTGEVETRQPVSRDIGNFDARHVSYVRDEAAPPLNRRLEHAQKDVPESMKAIMSTPIDPSGPPEAAKASQGLFLRHNLRKNHWKIAGSEEPTDYRTVNKIAFEERQPPHQGNRKGFKNSWMVVDHSVYPNIPTLDATALAPSSSSSSQQQPQQQQQQQQLHSGEQVKRMTSLNMRYNPYEDDIPSVSSAARNAFVHASPAGGVSGVSVGTFARKAHQSAGVQRTVPTIPSSNSNSSNASSTDGGKLLTVSHSVNTSALMASSASKLYGGNETNWTSTQKVGETAHCLLDYWRDYWRDKLWPP